MRTAHLLVVLSLATGCPGGGNYDTGNADVTISRDGVDDLRLIHDPELSQVSVTPPVGGVVELTFAYQDPLVTVSVVANADAIQEADTLTLPVSSPLSAEDLLITLDIDDTTFTSDAPGAAGTVTFDVLDVDESSDFADVIVSLDVTLASGDATAGLVGSLEARTGEPAEDESADAPVNDDD